MQFEKFISRNNKVMLGKPVILGTRITVELILTKLSAGYTIPDLLEAYPHLSQEQIVAAIEYASAIVANEEVVEV